jgi:RNA polymerase sigma factor (sigma-70 family)
MEITTDWIEEVIARVMRRRAKVRRISPQDEEDYQQEARIAAWESMDRAHAAENPEAYMYRVISNTLARCDKMRMQGMERDAGVVEEIRAACPEVQDFTPADAALEMEALESLAENDMERAVLVLRFVNGFTLEETANTLGATHYAVRLAEGNMKRRAARNDLTLGRPRARVQWGREEGEQNDE